MFFKSEQAFFNFPYSVFNLYCIYISFKCDIFCCCWYLVLHVLWLLPLCVLVHQDWVWCFPVGLAVPGPSTRWGRHMPFYVGMGGQRSLKSCVSGMRLSAVLRMLCFRHMRGSEILSAPRREFEVNYWTGARCVYNGSMSPIVCERWHGWRRGLLFEQVSR